MVQVAGPVVQPRGEMALMQPPPEEPQRDFQRDLQPNCQFWIETMNGSAWRKRGFSSGLKEEPWRQKKSSSGVKNTRGVRRAEEDPWKITPSKACDVFLLG